MNRYFGTYHDFNTVSKKDAAVLLGADNMVGDTYRIESTLENDIHTCSLISRFDQNIGYFDPDFSRELDLLRAQGCELCAILSFVAFSNDENEGHYWGNVAVIAYDKAYAAEFETYVSNIAARLADGIRPDISLSEAGVNEVIESGGTWTPDKTVPYPNLDKSAAYMKKHRTLSDKLIEEGRAGNKGCYIGGWAALLIFVAVVVVCIKSCAGL